jgi:predicted HicB family RNase H-like nuclease
MKKAELMEYRGYYGSVYFDAQEKIFYGKIEFIRDLVNYEAHDANSLLKSFHEAVDDYIQDCKATGKTPDKPFKGSFNVRIEPDLHREASLYAMQHGSTLNSVIKEALNKFISK